MRILVFHNWYQQPGGEDNVVRTEMALLADHGHAVELLDADNHSITTWLSKVQTAGSAAHSPAAKRHVTEELARVQPDIVHVHNFFPLLTPAILDACREAGVPVVHTLHNFRLLCPGATLLRDGRVCELCVTGSTVNAVRYRCYRDSYPGSAAVAWMVGLHRYLRTFERQVDRFIALTDFARSIFVKAGFPADLIAVKPDATLDPFVLYGDPHDRPAEDATALYLGRLSPEKGVQTLLKAWRNVPAPLRVAGAGPLETIVQAAARDPRERVTYVGQVSPEGAHEELSRARFLVMPSRCYEGFGIVIIEAFAHGTPVLASRLGSMAELVDDGVTGLLFEPGDAKDLARKAMWLFRNPDEARRMGKAARRTFEERYTLECNYDRLMSIYDKALVHAAQREEN
jgi:glycosyltransferase involved in cell wall biosynthesis